MLSLYPAHMKIACTESRRDRLEHGCYQTPSASVELAECEKSLQTMHQGPANSLTADVCCLQKQPSWVL